jgi:hypothetical protein
MRIAETSLLLYSFEFCFCWTTAHFALMLLAHQQLTGGSPAPNVTIGKACSTA